MRIIISRNLHISFATYKYWTTRYDVPIMYRSRNQIIQIQPFHIFQKIIFHASTKCCFRSNSVSNRWNVRRREWKRKVERKILRYNVLLCSTLVVSLNSLRPDNNGDPRIHYGRSSRRAPQILIKPLPPDGRRHTVEPLSSRQKSFPWAIECCTRNKLIRVVARPE